jgi:AcrR family transcriptional regulator
MEPMEDKRKRQKENTREQIISAAKSVFSSKGFSVTTQEIADEAGVAHGTVFVHFSTRDELQRKILEQFADEIQIKLHDLSVSTDSIEEILYAHIEVLEEYEQFYANILRDLTYLPHETYMFIFSMQSVMSHHLGKVVARNQKRGTIKDIPLHMLFNTWIGLLHYYLRHGEVFAPGGSVLKRRKKELVDAYMLMITK